MVPYGYAPECMASAFCVHELLVEHYVKHLAKSNRSTPLSESRARNLSSPEFVVWYQYGGHLCSCPATRRWGPGYYCEAHIVIILEGRDVDDPCEAI